uniref:uncharacterized protein LOC117252648 isoform X2 n=1 Tax=Epinephelus lanceolatus TaxID=310571 RepID=UPI001446320D|nr:uncharacterized protein LOC117252648 isoform X2 [Epinephelus lanceolatus]
MAAHIVNVYADENSTLFLDRALSKPLNRLPYRTASDPHTLFLDEQMTVRLEIHLPGLQNAADGASGEAMEAQSDPTSPTEPPNETMQNNEESNKEAMEEQSDLSTEVPNVPMQVNEVFTRDLTLFLIDLMRHRMEEDGGDLPRSLKELNARVRLGKRSKKQMWQEMAAKLTNHFGVVFGPDKVARKWGTLEESYKRIKDNNRTTGQGTMRFQFYAQMEELLGGHHDVTYPAVGTAQGLEIRRPEDLRLPDLSSCPPGSSTSLPGSSTTLPGASTTLPVSFSRPPGSSTTLPGASTTLPVFFSCPPGSSTTLPGSSTSLPGSSSRHPYRRCRPEEIPLAGVIREVEAASQQRHLELMALLTRSNESFENLMGHFLDKD